MRALRFILFVLVVLGAATVAQSTTTSSSSTTSTSTTTLPIAKITLIDSRVAIGNEFRQRVRFDVDAALVTAAFGAKQIGLNWVTWGNCGAGELVESTGQPKANINVVHVDPIETTTEATNDSDVGNVVLKADNAFEGTDHYLLCEFYGR